MGTPSTSTAAGNILCHSVTSVCLTLGQDFCRLSLPLDVQVMGQTQSLLPKLWHHPEQPLLLTASRVLPLPGTLPTPNSSPALVSCSLPSVQFPGHQLLPFLRQEQLLLLPGNPGWISLQCAHKISNVFPLSQVAGQGNPPCSVPPVPSALAVLHLWETG